MSNRRPQATRKPWHNAANYGTKHDGRSTQNQGYSSKRQQCASDHCRHCGRQCGRLYTNVFEDCPAFGSTCRGCGKANHWIKMCMAGAKDARTRPTRPVMTKKQGIHALENSKDTDNQSELYFDQLDIDTLGTAGNTDGTHALVQLKFQSPQCTNQLICKLDTGAEGNVIPLLLFLLAAPTWLWGRCGRHKSPPASSVMDLVFSRSDGSHVSVDIVHPSLLRSSSLSSPGWYHLQSLSSDVVLVSPLYVAKPHESRFPAPLCDTLYLQSLLDVFISHMVSYRVAACPYAHLHLCHFQFLHLGASDWHRLHPVQNSWLNDHLVDLSLHVWWYSLVA